MSAGGLTREQLLERLRQEEETRPKPMRSGCLEAGRRLAEQRRQPDPPAPGLVFWGSDCVLEGGCEGNATPGSMRCDDCKSAEHTVALWRAT